ncbi:MAG: exodeoxyribonuclease V subunit gamma [Simkaniaceae bacterium]|nr:exodeoxyribonuclease V subunit gamma [Simkaniaceae bacterium]
MLGHQLVRSLPKLHLSNSSELLIENLKTELYTSSSNCTRKLLVLPCDSIKKKIERAVCDDERMGLLIGVRFLNLNLLLDELLSLFGQSHVFASQRDLSFLIRSITDQEGSKGSELSQLEDYFKETSLNDKAVFCDLLAGLFLNYGQYFGSKWEEWVEKNGWQQYLIKELNAVFDFPSTFIPKIQSLQSPQRQVDVHIFALPHIPSIYLDFLTKASLHLSISIYLMSYSDLFWGDLYSTRKRRAIDSELDQPSPNPLFGNLCKLGQSLFCDLIDRNFVAKDHYLHPQWNNEPSLLKRIQTDLFELQSYDAYDKQNEQGFTMDSSLQICRAPTRLREVENIFNQLLKLWDQFDLDPDRIVVLAPDINEYVPLIEFVFGNQDSPIGYCIEGVNLKAHSDVYMLADLILTMVESRWDKHEVFQLIESSIIQSKWGISIEDVSKIKGWFEQCHLTWGFDLGHRAEFIEVDPKELQKSGTLSDVFSCCLLALAMSSDLSQMSSSFTPPFEIEFSQAQLLEKVMSCFQEIKSFRDSVKKTTQSLDSWCQILITAFETLFSLPSLLSDQRDDFNRLMQDLRSIFRFKDKIGDFAFDWPTISKGLKRIVEKKKGIVKVGNKPMVRFASIQTGETFVSDVVILIGMQGSSFPRYSPQLAMDELLHLDQPPFYPQTAQIDRYFFLEAITQANYFLVISALSKDDEGKQEDFSICVNDLLSHIDRISPHPSEKAKTWLVQEVQELSFEIEALKESYLNQSFRLAKAYYDEKAIPHQLFSILNGHPANPMGKNNRIIDISQLLKMSRHPIQFILNEKYQIYLDSNDKNELWLKEFVLSALDKARARQIFLKSFKDPTELFSKQRMPFSSELFSKIAQIDLTADLGKINELLKAYHLDKEDLFSIHFSRFTDVVKEIDRGVIEHPSIKIEVDNEEYELVGKLDQLSSQGALLMGKHHVSDLFKFWPQLLLLQALDHSVLQNKNAITLKDGKVREVNFPDWQKALESYVHYYITFKDRISFLVPSLAESILIRDQTHFEKEVNSLYDESEFQIDDPYFKALFQTKESFLETVSYEKLSSEMKEHFFHFIEWYKEK